MIGVCSRSLILSILRSKQEEAGEHHMQQTIGLIALLVLAAGQQPAMAHHSFAAEFDIDKPIQLQGKVTQVEFMNPHSWIHIEVTNTKGEAEQWEIEGGTPNTLFRKGINQDTLAIGTEIVVEGYQSRDGANRASGRNLTLTDGRKLFIEGSSTP
jgi:hypothetical protein